MNNNERRMYEGEDYAIPGAWDLGLAYSHTGDVLWRCDALRAGRLYHRSLFGSRQEAEQFAAKMREMEPDQMFNVEAIRASAVWN